MKRGRELGRKREKQKEDNECGGKLNQNGSTCIQLINDLIRVTLTTQMECYPIEEKKDDDTVNHYQFRLLMTWEGRWWLCELDSLICIRQMILCCVFGNGVKSHAFFNMKGKTFGDTKMTSCVHGATAKVDIHHPWHKGSLRYPYALIRGTKSTIL